MNNSILDATPNNLQHFMLLVVHQVQGQEDAWPFLEPVSPHEVPDYRDIIKVRPLIMHLQLRLNSFVSLTTTCEHALSAEPVCGMVPCCCSIGIQVCNPVL